MKISKNIIRYIASVILMTLSFVSRGQQEPVLTHYNFNTQLINPAYTGSWDNTGFVLLGRHQWLGMERAPRTYALSFQTSSLNEKIGLGLNVINDVIGYEKRFGLFGDYSYGFKVDEESLLRLGLKFGFTSYSNDFTKYVQYPGMPDPAIRYDRNSRLMPNFGVGAYYFSEYYYFGISIPKLMENDFENQDNFSAEAELRHFYFIAGYVFELSESLKFKPTLLTKATVGVPVNFDLTANFLLQDKIWLGAMYRSWGSVGFIAQWIIDNQLRLGYTADFSTGKIQQFNSGSHEIMVSYELDFGKKEKKWSSPRMF